MAPGQNDPRPEDGRILSPEELDIADDDHVEEIDDGRYVVSPDVRTESVTPVSSSDEEAGSAGRPALDQPTFSDPSVHEWLEQSLDETNSRYGFDVTAKFEGSVSQQQLVSNDIVTVFESLVLWFARNIDDDTPIEQVLGILLSESSVPVRYPPSSLGTLVDSTELSPDDSIADLLDAVGDDDGVQR